jgi:hypothetical protein
MRRETYSPLEVYLLYIGGVVCFISDIGAKNERSYSEDVLIVLLVWGKGTKVRVISMLTGWKRERYRL